MTFSGSSRWTVCRYYAVNYATIQFAPMLATAVCPDLLVGWLYDREAQRQHPDLNVRDLKCSGGVCFRKAFLILFALSLIVRISASLVPHSCSLLPVLPDPSLSDNDVFHSGVVMSLCCFVFSAARLHGNDVVQVLLITDACASSPSALNASVLCAASSSSHTTDVAHPLDLRNRVAGHE